MTQQDELRKSQADFIHTCLQMALTFTDAARQPAEEMKRRFDAMLPATARAQVRPAVEDPRAWLLLEAQGLIDKAHREANFALEDYREFWPGTTSTAPADQDEVALAFDTPDDDEFYLEFNEGEVH